MSLAPSPTKPFNAAPNVAVADLAIVIVSWNTKSMTRDCLRTVYEDLGSASASLCAEVWVVDNASDDGSAEMVREEFGQARLIANRGNIGFARANNQALRETGARYLLLLNSDTLIPPGALAALVRALEENKDAAVVSPLLLNADGSPQICWARFRGAKSEWTGKLDRSQSPYPLPVFADTAERLNLAPFAADWVGGACFLVRGDAANKVGLLDEDFFMYGEEMEWCLRFSRAGWKTLLVPSVTVTHLGGGSSRRVPIETRARMHHSSVRFFRLAYGAGGAFVPSLLSHTRFFLSRFKRWHNDK